MIRSNRTRAAIAVTAAVLVLVASVALAAAPSSASVDTQLQTARDLLANCQLLAAHSSGGTQRTRAQQCVTDQQAIIRLLTAPSPTVLPPSPTPGSTTPPPTTAPPTTVPPTTTPAVTAPPTTPPPGGFPDAASTGVPDGVTLTPYTGPCLIRTSGTVIDRSSINCDLVIHASNVVISNSRIRGNVQNADDPSLESFTLVDSEVIVGTRTTETTGVAGRHYTLLRVEITGGNRGAFCEDDCLIQDSYVHGTQVIDDWHASAVRMQTRLTLRHNTLVCDAAQAPPRGTLERGSCSASLTGYGDWEPGVQDNLIEGNWFPATVYAAYCAYGGSSLGKPYTDGERNVVFRDNVFSHIGSCALYGPIGDWRPDRPGNVWDNNRYDDGRLIPNVLS